MSLTDNLIPDDGELTAASEAHWNSHAAAGQPQTTPDAASSECTDSAGSNTGEDSSDSVAVALPTGQRTKLRHGDVQAMVQHTDVEVTEIWKSGHTAFQMAASVVLACAQLGVAWYFSATYSMTFVTSMLLVEAWLTFTPACLYFIHRARGDEPTLIQMKKALNLGAVGVMATGITAFHLLIFSAAVAVVPAVQRGALMPMGTLLLTFALLAAQILLVQLPLSYKCQRMQRLLELSVDTASHGSHGADADKPAQHACGSDAHSQACMLPGHTDPEATELWRATSTACTLALHAVLACVQVAAAALCIHFDAGAFVAIMLATSAVHMFVVTGRYCVLRAAGREPSWEQANTVRRDTELSLVASLTTYMALMSYFITFLVLRSDAEDDPVSPETDRPGGTQFQYRGAGLFFTFFILDLFLAALFVQARVIGVSRKMMHVISLSHAEKQRREHPGGDSNVEHAPAQERPEKLSEEQRAPAGREWHSSER